MIKLENYEVCGLEHAIRGMRNPWDSHEKSDSYATHIENPQSLNTAEFEYFVGDADKELMLKLANGGPVHAKYRRMIDVYVDITAPLYWWKEFDTYKVGTVANSCSTMHTIAKKEFTVEDFSCEHLNLNNYGHLLETIDILNEHRNSHNYLKSLNTLEGDRGAKNEWWQMIQLLPSSYNQKRTVKLNYEVLANIYRWRKDHKLDEWHTFCEWIETLPHSDIITLREGSYGVKEG